MAGYYSLICILMSKISAKDIMTHDDVRDIYD